ncbi:MAG TPA: tetratricopeptide repeat protein [Steroidobacteraceae bacterium]|jgi:tetratricopeptide (TPR) repeat protein|nr:tetratricopeptide repeat protein [Steroidobacteraceae bacterium]
MQSRHLTLAVLQLLAAAALVSAAPGPAQASSPSLRDVEDSNALIMTAEIALQRDDCGRAAANYTIAAQRLTDAKLAERAAGVALDCGQYQAAERAAARWRQLTPSDPAALRAAMRADLGLYKIDDARSAFEAWIKNGGGYAAPKNSRRAGGAGAGSAAGDDNIADQLGEVAQEAGVPVTLAMLRGTQLPRLQTGRAQLALASLAFDGWNYREALEFGQRALSAGADRAPTQLLLARAHAGLGEADQAVAAAGAARVAAPKEQSFAAADVLILLGRERDARMALEGLRDTAGLRTQAERRLGLLAFDRGDYDEAQSVFSALLKDPESSGVAVYYLAAIAERRGEIATALRGYQMLGGTGLEGAARSRAANILYKEGQRDDALELLQAKDDASLPTRLEAEIAQAQLLSNGGEGDQALARIDDALARFPGHPDVLYQKAILLEKAGRTDAAIAQLEALYRTRPQDSAISNALGFILADHNRDLSRAERLINSALKSEPDNPAILDSLGWLQYRRGMLQAALPLLERAYRLDQDGDIGAHWGEVLWALGDKTKARDVWNRALMVDPDNALVKAAQQRVGVPSLTIQGTGTSI